MLQHTKWWLNIFHREWRRRIPNINAKSFRVQITDYNTVHDIKHTNRSKLVRRVQETCPCKTLKCKSKTNEEPEIKIAYYMMCQQTRFESAKM